MLKRMILTLAVATWLAMPAAAQHNDAASTAHEAASTAANVPQGTQQAVAGQAEAAHGDAAHGDAHGGHEKAPLIPDPTKGATQLQALWVVIIFVILLAILYPTAWKNVLAGLKAREERIRKDIADAEAARGRAEATLREYNQRLATAESQVNEILKKAGADAERLATNIRMQAQQEAEEAKERATREIEASRQAAIASIYEQAADLATNVAEKIIRRNLNPQDQQDLVRQSLDQLQTVNGR